MAEGLPVAVPEASSLDVVTEALGHDLVFHVFTFASRYDLAAVARVCRAWRRIVGDPLLAQPPPRLLGYMAVPPFLANGSMLIILRRALDACDLGSATPETLTRVYAMSDATTVTDGKILSRSIRIGNGTWTARVDASLVYTNSADIVHVDAKRAATLLTGTATTTFCQGDGDDAPQRVHRTEYVGGVAMSTTVER
jgi:hypothetical protein